MTFFSFLLSICRLYVADACKTSFLSFEDEWTVKKPISAEQVEAAEEEENIDRFTADYILMVICSVQFAITFGCGRRDIFFSQDSVGYSERTGITPIFVRVIAMY